MNKLILNTSSGDYLIDPATIVRVEASSNYSKLFFNDGKMLVTAKLLSWFEVRLRPGMFTRLHRSHLVNNDFLMANQCINSKAPLKDGCMIPVSKRRKKIVLQKLAAACLFFLISLPAFSQNVGIGTPTPHASAQLEINSTTKGTLITTMTTTQRNAIPAPATGLLVFDIDKKTIYMYDGNRWLPFLVSNSNKTPPTLVNPSVFSNDFFGYKVAIDGDYAIIGAYGRNGITLNAGGAYIYHRGNGVWEQQDLLYASDGADDDYFGASISISGDYAVIGAWGDDIGADANQGSIYIFQRSGTVWTQQIKLTAADGAANDFFGYSVDITNTGSTIVVGAYGDNIGANTNQGSAYIYTRSGAVWSLQAKLTASDGDVGDSFGASVSAFGSYIIVGSYLDDIGANVDQGSVYSFYEFTNAGGWTSGQAYQDKITADDGAAEDFFGVSVSISGAMLIVGASGDDIGTNVEQGSAYTFYRNPVPPNPWILPAKIVAPDGAANDNFGISVSHGGTYSVVGAYRYDEGGFLNQGAAYIFITNSTNPVFRRKIDDDAGDPNGYFGYAVGISGFEVIVGAYGKNNNAGQVGFLNIQ
ncbi:MAG TPA: LytTR family transcriptional regulator DNA-binding domain-containing protein [Chitinophagaceae bacterium]|jgi:hypothetical protein|nr:LytTR family transcriptional regulator DNA-binding domain-containing protein [Chitinophagaceae bacterium]